MIGPKNKTMILGDMFELGIESAKEHQFILDLALQHNLNTIFIGNEFYKQKINHNKLLFFENFKIFENFLIENPINTQSILIKGSRGMALERILNFL